MDLIQQISQELDHCYNTIVTWRKNFFLIPRVNASKKFICELTRLINSFNNNTIMKEVALKAVRVFMPIILQKPAKKLKGQRSLSIPTVPRKKTSFMRTRKIRFYSKGMQ